MSLVLATLAAASLTLPSTWRSTFVGGGSAPSIAFDARSVPHAALVSDQGIVLARRARWGWTTGIVDGRGGTSPSLAIDSEGRPHIAYASQGTLRYAVLQSSGRWRIEDVDSVATGPVALALGPRDAPRIAYAVQDEFDEAVRLAARSGLRWVIDVIPYRNIFCEHVDLAVDARDVPHLLFDHDESFHYATLGVGGWWSERVADDYVSASIAIGPSGTVHIAYSAGIDDLEGVTHCVRSDPEWRCDPIEPGVRGRGISLAVGEGDTPQVSYGVDRALRFGIARSGRAWVLADVAEASLRRDLTTSLALDAGEPWIAYDAPDGVHAASMTATRSPFEVADWRRRFERRLPMDGTPRDEDGFGLVGEGAAATLTARPLPYRGGTLDLSFAPRGNGPCEVAVYDLSGRCVRTLARGDYSPAEHRVRWDGRDDAGRPAPAGVLFVRFAQGNETTGLKVVHLP